MASTLWFFLTWFPNYLTQEKGITALKAGPGVAVVYLGYYAGNAVDEILPHALRLSGLKHTMQYFELARFCRPDKALVPHPA